MPRVSHGYSYPITLTHITHYSYPLPSFIHSFIHSFTTHTPYHHLPHSLIPLTSYHSPFSTTHHYSFIHHLISPTHLTPFITTHSFIHSYPSFTHTPHSLIPLTITYLIHSYPSYHCPLPRTITSYHHLPRSLTNSYPSPIAHSYHPPHLAPFITTRAYDYSFTHHH